MTTLPQSPSTSSDIRARVAAGLSRVLSVSVLANRRPPRVLYLQYTKPAAYPPLEHSARILADAGWRVTFLGTPGRGSSNTLAFAPHERISIETTGGGASLTGYLAFIAHAFRLIAVDRPDWLYVSDPAATPAGLLVSMLGVRVVYHEHDSPTQVGTSLFSRVCLTARVILARRAELCALPNDERAKRFRDQTRTGRDVLCVWNCPAREDVGVPRSPPRPGRLSLVYHGTVGPERIPEAVIRAVARTDGVDLHIAGYETIGSPRYGTRLVELAHELGAGDRVRYHGAIPQRADLLAIAAECDVGLAFMPIGSDDINMQHMVGASNKVFDYLAVGLAVIVSDLPEWRATFVDPGYGVACDPMDEEALAAMFARLRDDQTARVAMGEAGRKRIASDWNYESTFEPVKQRMVGKRSQAIGPVECGSVLVGHKPA